MKTIFLSGPMRGVPRDVSLSWRINLEKKLEGKFNVLHAFRGREEKETMPDPKGAVIRDKNDIINSDLIVVNDTFENVSMVGTSMEIFFANSLNKPIIVFGNVNKGNYWYDAHIHIRVGTIEEVEDVLIKLFQ
jgi:nucleoside 2-deoxyribosyltransferase